MNSDGKVHQKTFGAKGSKVVVFVARTANDEYFGLSLNEPGQGISASESSSNHDIARHGWHCEASLRSIGHALPSNDSTRESNANVRADAHSNSAVDDFSDWGKPPPVNSDSHLRATWPETEAVLRSLGLFNGIHTDLQSLQQINWIHRVSIFKLITLLLINPIMCLLVF